MRAYLQLGLLSCVLSTGFAVRVVCYYTNWSAYGNEPFKVEDIDARLCTHVVYSFLALEANGNVKPSDPWNDVGDEWHEGALKKFLNLKSSNPSVKILLGVGGWNEGNFQSVLISPEKRKTFLESTLRIIRFYRFDGLEMDFFHHSDGGFKEDFCRLLREMKPKFQESGFTLGIATSANPVIFDNSYDIVTLSNYSDFINVLSYDLHGSWDGRTGHGAPLHPPKADPKDELNLEAVIKRYIRKGAVPSKLNLGLSLYGRTFTLMDPSRNGVGSPSSGPGKKEPLPYREFCLEDNRGLWTKHSIEDQRVPYAVSGNQWVGYEDVSTVVDKVKFAKSQKLGGVHVWSLDFDDFKGKCGKGRYPLLAAAKEEILKTSP